VFDVHFLMRLVDRTELSEAPSAWSSQAFVAAAQGMPDEVALARRWTDEEARWHFSRPGSFAATVASGSESGAIAGHCAPVLDGSGLRSVSIEDVLWQTLPSQERHGLLSQFIAAAASRGADVIGVPVLGYADLSEFRAAGFRKTRRLLHAYLTRWTADPVAPFDAMYLDVI
jgi:hypothetical protein